MVYSDLDHVDFDDKSGDFYITRSNGTVNLYNRQQEPELFDMLNRLYSEGQIEINIIEEQTQEPDWEREFRQEYREKYGEEFEDWSW